jgi:hypothetical protein
MEDPVVHVLPKNGNQNQTQALKKMSMTMLIAIAKINKRYYKEA